MPLTRLIMLLYSSFSREINKCPCTVETHSGHSWKEEENASSSLSPKKIFDQNLLMCCWKTQWALMEGGGEMQATHYLQRILYQNVLLPYEIWISRHQALLQTLIAKLLPSREDVTVAYYVEHQWRWRDDVVTSKEVRAAAAASPAPLLSITSAAVSHSPAYGSHGAQHPARPREARPRWWRECRRVLCGASESSASVTSWCREESCYMYDDFDTTSIRRTTYTVHVSWWAPSVHSIWLSYACRKEVSDAEQFRLGRDLNGLHPFFGVCPMA